MSSLTSRNPLIFVLLSVLVDSIGFGIISPVLPALIMDVAAVDLAASARIAGYLMLIFAGLQFLFGPVLGNLSDAYGRRPVLLFSMLAFSANYALMGFSQSLVWLFVGRGLTGIAGALYGAANAFVADVSPPDKRAQGFGFIGAAFGLGFVLGPALGGFLGELGPRAPFFAAAALAGLNFIYGMLVLPESLPKERRRPFALARANPVGALRAFRGEPRVLWLAAIAFIWQIGFHVYPATWSFFVIAKFGLSPAAIGGTLALAGLSMTVVQGLLTSRIVARIGEHRAAPLGVIAAVVTFSAYAFVSESWMLYPILVFNGLQGIANPALTAMMSRALGAERQGELSGALASMIGLSLLIGPLLLSQTLAYFTSAQAPVYFPGAAFVLSALLAFCCLLMLLPVARSANAKL
jgi:MFS transporter, DHA1 family, tetracycline resistance protein